MSEEIEGQTVIEEEPEEIIVSELPGDDEGGTRTIRVYDHARGDYTLEMPSGYTITFGYFNPAAPKFATTDQYGSRRPSDVAAATALRIYAGKTTKSPQVACFLDVQGFRDLALKLVRLRQRVVIESNFEDDGDGNEQFNRGVQRALVAKNEDEDIPF